MSSDNALVLTYDSNSDIYELVDRAVGQPTEEGITVLRTPSLFSALSCAESYLRENPVEYGLRLRGFNPPREDPEPSSGD